MWRDTREARLKRYREILTGSPRLYGAAEASRGEINVTDQFAKALWMDRNQRETFEDVCSYVLAPALNSFVRWVLQEAMASGKKRLYFLARDGYLMYKAALVYCEKLNLPIECRYLSCSRYSIRIPMFQLDMEEAMDYICRGGIDVTMDKILNRAGLTEEEKEKVLKDLNLGFLEDGLLPYAILQEIRKELQKCDSFQTYLFRHSREAMPGLEGYLIQEGLLDGIPSALVDSGWVGSMQKILGQVTEYMQKKDQMNVRVRLEGYYWGLYELPAGVKPEEYHCYYFSPKGNLKEKVYFSNCLFEGMFSAPHGMTVGYEKKAGIYQPVYGEISDNQKKFMELTEKRLLDYTRELARRLCEPEPDEKKGSHSDFREVLEQIDFKHDREIICQLLELFMGEPTALEAEVYGSLHFSDDVLDYGGHQMAEPMTEEELTANHLWHKALAMLGVQKKHVKESAWYEGSAVRSGKNVKRHLRRYAGYKYMLYLRKKYQMRNPSRHDKR